MRLKTVLYNVTGEDIARELNGYGISLVRVDPAFPDKFMHRADLQRFVRRYAISRDTPHVYMKHASLFQSIFAGPIVENPEIAEITAVGRQFTPGAGVEAEQIHEMMVNRLMTGLPITLISQTANALRLDAEDLRAIEFSRLERALLNWTVRHQRRPGAEPVLMIAAFADGERRKPLWWLSLARYRATRRFAPINRGVLRWAVER